MNEIQQWLSDSQHDYNIGVALYQKYGKNKSLANYFRTGTPQFRMAKLVYELGKLASNSSVAKASTKIAVPTVTSSPVVSRNEMPAVILAAKKEISSLYSTIDRMHKELYDTGSTNAPAAVKKRKRMLDARKPIIETAEKLYNLKEEWFRGNTSVETQIREILSGNKEESVPAPSPSESTSLLSDIQLVKRRTQLRSYITKTQNMLTYQSVRKMDAPSPMPDGPKRKTYEEKLQMLKAEYKNVCDEISKRSK